MAADEEEGGEGAEEDDADDDGDGDADFGGRGEAGRCGGGGDGDEHGFGVFGEDALGEGEAPTFVVDPQVGFLEECAAEGVLRVIGGSPEWKIFLVLLDARVWLGQLQVEAVIGEDNVGRVTARQLIRKRESDAGVELFKRGMQVVIDQIQSGL